MTRLDSYLHYFGLQGGTIHQISDMTGVPVSILLDGEIQDKSGQSECAGWWTHRTCSKEFRVHKSHEYHGDSDYWVSVAESYLIDKRG